MSQLSLLYRLQQIDSEIRAKKKQLGAVLAAQKASPELLVARERADGAAGELATLQKNQRETDLELGGIRSSLEQAEGRLYSGKVKLTAELTDLQKKISMMKRQQEALEETGLEILIALEEAEAENDSAQAALTAAEKSWEAKTASLRDEQLALATTVNEWMTKRQEILPMVERASLVEYNEVTKRRGGVAVVGVRREVCQGCQVKISTGIVEKARRGDFVYCPNCLRIVNPL